jgi:hypothetical protein
MRPMRRLWPVLLALLAAPPVSPAVAASVENRTSGLPAGSNNTTGIEPRLSENAVRENYRLAYEVASDDAVAARGILATPKVSSPKLQNIINDLYKGTTNPGRVGTGTTADAVRHELATGKAVGGRFHSQKAGDYARGLENWLRGNPNAPYQDRLVAQSVLDDLRSALGGGP